MSNRAERRRAARNARRGIPGFRPGEAVQLTRERAREIMLDGFDCPYCTRRVLSSEEAPGLFVCDCGWSGGFVDLDTDAGFTVVDRRSA